MILMENILQNIQESLAQIVVKSELFIAVTVKTGVPNVRGVYGIMIMTYHMNF